MKTQKPLRQMLPEIMEHIHNHNAFLMYNTRLLLVHEGQLREEIEASLRAELGNAAYLKAIKRVPSINVLVRIIDKLSRVYSEPAMRTPATPGDDELLRYYEKGLNLPNVMPSANRMLNLHKCCALEPFVCEGKPELRVIPASQFLVYSDSPINPLKMTVFIKLIGRELKTPLVNADGRNTRPQDPYYVDVYCLYSDDEILIIDSDGGVRADKMTQREMDGTNPIGIIPFVYLNRSEFRLIPLPDTDTLDNTILIPKLLADLNYAVQFQSHSIVVTTDLNLPADVPWNPDVILDLKTDDGSTQQGTVTTIKPTVDIASVLMLIETTLSLWLEARNIKTTGAGQVTAESASSGVAKLIDESDATQDRRAQMIIFERAEADLWKLLVLMHDFWSSAAMIEERKKFSPDFSIGLQFANMGPMKSEAQEIEAVKALLESGLTDKRSALTRLNPHMSVPQIDELLLTTGGSDTRLNGAQFDSVIGLVTAVASGTVPRDAGISILAQGLSVTPEQAEEMLGSAGLEPVGGEGESEGGPGPSEADSEASEGRETPDSEESGGVPSDSDTPEGEGREGG